MIDDKSELTLREQEEQRLRMVASELYISPKPGFFSEKSRLKAIEDYVKNGLEKFDEQQSRQDEASDEELIFHIEL